MPYKFAGLNQKPPLGARIDGGNPLSKDLLIFAPMNEGIGGIIRNIANQQVFTFSDGIGTAVSDYAWGADNYGVYSKNNSAADSDLHSWTLPASSRYDISNGITWGVLAKFQPTSNARCFHRWFSAGTLDWGIGAFNATDFYTYIVTSGGATLIQVPSIGGAEFIVGTFDGLNSRAYQNGVLKTTTANTGTAANAGGPIMISNHNQGLGTPVRWLQPIYAVYLWNRVLSSAEIRDLYANPYQLAYAPKNYVFAIGVAPIGQTASDQINTMADVQTNSGYTNAAAGFYDTMQLQDAIAVFGGDPDFQILFGDNLGNLKDSLGSLAPVILKSFSDTLNNLSDSAAKALGIPIAAFDSNQFNWADALSTVFAGVLNQTASDSANNLADAVSVNAANVPFLITASDTLNHLNDAIRLWNVLRIFADDNMVLSDSLKSRMAHLMRLSDVLSTFLEGLGISVKSNPAFADQMTFSDSAVVSMFTNLTKTAADQMSMTDSVVAVATGNYNPASLISRIRRYLNDPQ